MEVLLTIVVFALIVMALARALGLHVDSANDARYWRDSAAYWKNYGNSARAAQSAALADFFLLPFWRKFITPCPPYDNSL